MFELEVETEFAAAHALREYKGKCENLHGHNYRVLLSVAGDNLDQIGMLCDFKEIKRLLKRVLEPIDHQYLNDTEPFCKMNPTTENLAKYICTEIAPQIVDNLWFPWSKCIVAEDEKIARIREVGRSIAKAIDDPGNAKYLGEPGFCSHCHSQLMFFHEGDNKVECAVCGIVGEIVIQEGKARFEFPAEQIERAHDTMSGKFIHLEDVGRNEMQYMELKKTDLFKQRQQAYRAFIQPSRPPKKQAVNTNA